MTLPAPLTGHTCPLCSLPATTGDFCSPACSANAQELIDFQQQIMHLTTRDIECSCQLCQWVYPKEARQ